MTSKPLLLTALTIGILLAATAVRAAPLPERTPPSGFASVNGPTGGRTLAGTFSGNARSAAAVLGGMLGALRGYFDGAPAVSSAVGDPNDRGIMAFFDARLQGTPVRGAAIVQLNDGGGGGVAIIFDRPADIARSFPGMSRQLGGIQVPGGGPAQRPVALQQQTTPDGKAAIGVPPGWRISGYANGAVDDRANKGFSYYIRGVEVLEHTPSGKRGNFDRDYADSVVRADPTKYRLVPPSQYRTTD